MLTCKNCIIIDLRFLLQITSEVIFCRYFPESINILRFLKVWHRMKYLQEYLSAKKLKKNPAIKLKHFLSLFLFLDFLSDHRVSTIPICYDRIGIQPRFTLILTTDILNTTAVIEKRKQSQHKNLFLSLIFRFLAYAEQTPRNMTAAGQPSFSISSILRNVEVAPSAGGLSAVHSVVALFLAALMLMTACLGVQYAHRYRKYQLAAAAEDQDSLTGECPE